MADGSLVNQITKIKISTGRRGLPGEAGSAGPQGIQGETGPIGPQGLKGDTGEVGPAGPQGLKGDTGEVGPAGPQGLKGDTGEVGPAGPQGLKGDTGEFGPAGPQGENGSSIPYSLQCAEQILEGMWISIVDINGISKIKKASAATGELVDGYVLSTYEQDSIGTFYMAGENTKAISISNGIVYLSHTTPGRETTEQPPEGYGYYLQKIGKSIGSGIVLLDKGIPIKLN